jgi:hypothetical protein
MARFIADAHHRGVLWRLPMRVVENLPLVGLDFLLEGSAYQRTVIEQLLRLQAEWDWDSWTRRGFGAAGAVPIHLVGSEYRIQELASPGEIPQLGTSGIPRGVEVEEVISRGRARSPQVAVSRGSDGRASRLPRGPTRVPGLVPEEGGLEPEVSGISSPGSPLLVSGRENPSEGILDPKRRLTLDMDAAYPIPGTESFGMFPLPPIGRRAILSRGDLQDETRGGKFRPGIDMVIGAGNAAGDPRESSVGERSGPRNLFGSTGGGFYMDDVEGEYPEDQRRTYHSQSVIRVGDLEHYLKREGILGKAREVANSYEWTVETVETAFRRLLDSRWNHRWQAESQRQRISALETELTARVAHDRETAIRVNRLVGDLAAITVRCHEGPEVGRLIPGSGE